MDNQKSIKTSFWDFKNVKIYSSGGEQILDFIVGFITGGIILHFVPGYFLYRLFSFQYEQLSKLGGLAEEMPTFPIKETLLVFVIFVVMILVFLYLLRRRKHFAFGFLIPLIFNILAFVLALSSF